MTGWLEQLHQHTTCRRCLRGVALTVMVAAWLSSSAKADTIVVVVDGRSNVFGAGRAVPPGDGLPPPSFRFKLGPGQYIEFPSVTGTLTYDRRIPRPFQGPDGGPHIAPTNVFSTGISGIRHDGVTGFLVGVFLDDTEPMGAGPPVLNFSGATAFTDLFPALNQAFFIGDGLTGTGSGVTQRFHVPSAATRLFFGVADAWNGGSVTGPPGFYNDNGGAFVVGLALVPTAAIAASGRRLDVALACPSTARRGTTMDVTVTFRNTTAEGGTVSRGALSMHLGNVALVGPLALNHPSFPLAVPAGMQGVSITVPVPAPRQARPGVFASLGLGFFGRFAVDTTRRPLGSGSCFIEVVP